MVRIAALFVLAGLLEIGGGYLVWRWLREHGSPWLGAVGLGLLAAYGLVPVLQPRGNPFGRIYAAYGAVFVVLSLAWGAVVDGHRADARDLAGGVVVIAGAVIMLWPRT